MTCNECQDLLQEHVDSELRPAEKAALDAHLNSCRECAQLHKQLLKFTTTLVQTVRPLRPSANFSNEVLAKFEETKAQLQRLPSKDLLSPAAARSYPVWPFAAAMGLAVALGLFLLFRAPANDVLGRVTRGRAAARILAYQQGVWREVENRDSVQSNERVLAVDAPGAVVELDLRKQLGLKLFLRSPCAVQFERRRGRLIVRPLPEAPGRLHVQTTGAGVNPIQAVRILYSRAWVELPCAGKNAMDVEPGPQNELTVSVRSGSATLGNETEKAPLAEGYARTVPQKGPCSAAVQIPAEAFDWLKTE